MFQTSFTIQWGFAGGKAAPKILYRSRYFIFFCFSFFALCERKKRKTDKTESTMLPQAERRLCAAPRKSYN